jgi:predicted MFS family arabinose efflux permease
MGVVIVGAILQTTAFNVPHLIIGRIVTGAGTGLKTSTVPMYQAGKSDPMPLNRLIHKQ